MPEEPNWRSERFADTCAALDYAGFAFAFLRRNPAYIADLQRTIACIELGTLSREAGFAALTTRWGVCFPGRSGLAGARRSAVASGPSPGHRHRRRCA